MKRAIQAVVLLAFIFAIIGLIGSMFILDSKESAGILLPCLFATVMGMLVYVGHVVWTAGANDSDAPAVVASFPDELSASALVSRLESNGVNAQAIGGFTSTEFGSDVSVVVAATDYEFAMKVLREKAFNPEVKL